MWIFGYGSLLWKTNFPYEEKRHGYIKNYIRRFWQSSLDHRGTLEKPGRVVTLIHTGNLQDVVWGTAFKVAPQNIQRVIEYLDYREKNGYSKNKVMFYPTSQAIPGTGSLWGDEILIKLDNSGPPKNQAEIDSLTKPDFRVDIAESVDDTSVDIDYNNNENNSSDTHKKLFYNEGVTKFTLGDDVDGEGDIEENSHILLPVHEPFEVEAYIAEESNEHFLGPAPVPSIARQISASHGLSGSNLEYLLNLYRTLIDITPAGQAFDPDGHLRDLINCVHDESLVTVTSITNNVTTDISVNNVSHPVYGSSSNNHGSSVTKFHQSKPLSPLPPIFMSYTRCVKCDSISCGGKCKKHLNLMIRNSCARCCNVSSTSVPVGSFHHQSAESSGITNQSGSPVVSPNSIPTIKPTKS